MGRGLRHFAAHMKDFIKNGKQSNTLKILQILMKISKYTVPTLFLSFYQIPLGLGIKNIKKCHSRCKMRRETHNFVQANKDLYKKNVH